MLGANAPEFYLNSRKRALFCYSRSHIQRCIMCEHAHLSRSIWWSYVASWQIAQDRSSFVSASDLGNSHRVSALTRVSSSEWAICMIPKPTGKVNAAAVKAAESAGAALAGIFRRSLEPESGQRIHDNSSNAWSDDDPYRGVDWTEERPRCLESVLRTLVSRLWRGVSWWPWRRIVRIRGRFHDRAKRVRSWKERIDTLVELGFVLTAPRGTRPQGYILIPDPHKVVKNLHAAKRIRPEWWGAYIKRCSEIGYTLP